MWIISLGVFKNLMSPFGQHITSQQIQNKSNLGFVPDLTCFVLWRYFLSVLYNSIPYPCIQSILHTIQIVFTKHTVSLEKSQLFFVWQSKVNRQAGTTCLKYLTYFILWNVLECQFYFVYWYLFYCGLSLMCP